MREAHADGVRLSVIPPAFGERVWRVRGEREGQRSEREVEAPARAPLAEALAPGVREVLEELGAAPGGVRFETSPLAWLCAVLEGELGIWLGCRRNAALWREAGRSNRGEGEERFRLGRNRRSDGGWQTLWLGVQAFPSGGPASWVLLDDEQEIASWVGYGRGATRVTWSALLSLVSRARKRDSLRVHFLGERVFESLRRRPDEGALARALAERNLALELVFHRGGKLPDGMVAAWLRANELRWKRLSRAPHQGGCLECGRGVRIPTQGEDGAFCYTCTDCGAVEGDPLGDLRLRRWFLAVDCPGHGPGRRP